MLHQSDPLRKELERGADRIAAAVLIARAIINGKKAMAGKLNMPNLAGVAGAFDKLRYGIEDRAGKLMARIEAEGEAKADAIFKRAHAKLDEHLTGLDDMNEQLEALDKTLGNGAPEGSPPSSGEPGGPAVVKDYSGPFGA